MIRAFLCAALITTILAGCGSDLGPTAPPFTEEPAAKLTISVNSVAGTKERNRSVKQPIPLHLEKNGWEMAIFMQEISDNIEYARVIGQYSGATDGLDKTPHLHSYTGEPFDLEYPPAPIFNIQDFVLMNDGRRLARDIRNIDQDKMIFDIWVQFGTGNGSAAFTWNPDQLPPDAKGELQDATSGSYLADLHDGHVIVTAPLDKVRMIVQRSD